MALPLGFQGLLDPGVPRVRAVNVAPLAALLVHRVRRVRSALLVLAALAVPREGRPLACPDPRALRALVVLLAYLVGAVLLALLARPVPRGLVVHRVLRGPKVLPRLPPMGRLLRR